MRRTGEEFFSVSEIKEMEAQDTVLTEKAEMIKTLHFTKDNMKDVIKALEAPEKLLRVRVKLARAPGTAQKLQREMRAQDATMMLQELYNYVATQMLQQNNFKFAFELLKKAEGIAGSELVQAVTYNNMACYYRRIGKIRTAVHYLEKALEVEERNKEADVSQTHLNLCATLSQLNKHEKAMRHAHTAIIRTYEMLLPDLTGSKGKNYKANPVIQERVAVLCIAYHNLAVEEEFLKMPNSIETYKQGLRYGIKYLGADHNICAIIKRSLEAVQKQCYVENLKRKNGTRVAREKLKTMKAGAYDPEALLTPRPESMDGNDAAQEEIVSPHTIEETYSSDGHAIVPSFVEEPIPEEPGNVAEDHISSYTQEIRESRPQSKGSVGSEKIKLPEIKSPSKSPSIQSLADDKKKSKEQSYALERNNISDKARAYGPLENRRPSGSRESHSRLIRAPSKNSVSSHRELPESIFVEAENPTMPSLQESIIKKDIGYSLEERYPSGNNISNNSNTQSRTASREVIHSEVMVEKPWEDPNRKASCEPTFAEQLAEIQKSSKSPSVHVAAEEPVREKSSKMSVTILDSAREKSGGMSIQHMQVEDPVREKSSKISAASGHPVAETSNTISSPLGSIEDPGGEQVDDIPAVIQQVTHPPEPEISTPDVNVIPPVPLTTQETPLAVSTKTSEEKINSPLPNQNEEISSPPENSPHDIGITSPVENKNLIQEDTESCRIPLSYDECCTVDVASVPVPYSSRSQDYVGFSELNTSRLGEESATSGSGKLRKISKESGQDEAKLDIDTESIFEAQTKLQLQMSVVTDENSGDPELNEDTIRSPMVTLEGTLKDFEGNESPLRIASPEKAISKNENISISPKVDGTVIAESVDEDYGDESFENE